MASPPLPGGSRHVGRVIDPSVREDGEPEPALELNSERLAGESASEAEFGAGSGAESALPRGGRARELLLERAQSVRSAQGTTTEGSPSEPDLESLGDLEEIGRPTETPLPDPDLLGPTQRAPGAPERLGESGRLSPTLVAVFGTLLGVATVSSLVALGMSLDLPLPASAPAPSAATSASSAPPASAALAAPAPPPRRPKQPGPWRIVDARGEAGTRLVEGKIGTDSFLGALEKAAVPTREVYRVMKAMKGVRDFDRCKKNDKFSVLLDRASSRMKAFEYQVSAEEVYQAREGADGLLKGSRLDLKVERRQVTGGLVADGKSLDGSAQAAGLEAGLSRALAKALDGHQSLDEIEAGSRLRVIVQEVSVLGEFARYSGVEALEIVPPDSGKPFRLYYFDVAPERGYYDAEGHSPYEGGWRKPIPTAPMTSPFNLKRLHPILKKIHPHLGIDYGAPIGTPIGASNYGTVSFVGFLGPTGNLVKVEHDNGIETGYAHLSRFAEGIKVGDKVKRLQTIGYVGSTGRSTGPHLHFLARKNGEFIDPATLNMDAMRTISKANREAFAQVKAKYDAQLETIALPDRPASAAKPAPSVEASAASSVAAPAAPAPSNAELDTGEDDETPARPANAPANPARKPGSNVFLSDKELLELQGSSDDGEITE